MIGFGSLLGFRGSDEHVYLTVDQISNGHFPSNHPAFPGHEWYGLSHFNKDKVHKLDSKTGYVREGLEDELGRFPVLSNGKEGDISRDFGGALKRLLQKLPKDHKTRRFYRRLSKDKRSFIDSPLGKKKIRESFKSGFSRLGVSNPEKLWPHSLRAHFTTTLANDASVSMKEAMAATRHNSLSVNSVYQSRSKVTEANRLNALIGRKKSDAKFKRRKIVIDSADEEADEVIEMKNNKKRNGYNRKSNDVFEQSFHLNIESSSSDDSSNDGDKKLPAKMECDSNNFSVFTQAQVNRFHEEENTYSNEHANAVSTANAGNWMWDLNDVTSGTSSFTQNQINGYHHDHHRYEVERRIRRNVPLNRSPYNLSQSHAPISRVPSRRERAIIELRRKRRDEHEERMRSIENEERMRSFPYNSNEEEYEQLYLDSIQESLDNDRDHRRQSNGRYY